MEFHRLLIHPPFVFVFDQPVARVCPFQAGIQVDVEIDRQAGQQSAAGNLVKRHHHVAAKTARRALIGERGVGKPIRQNRGAPLQRGQNPFVDILRPARKVQQHLRGGGKFLVRRIQQDAANLQADPGAAWLGGLQNVLPFGAKLRRKQPHLRTFSAAVGSFKADEASANVSRRHNGELPSNPPRLLSLRSDCRAAADRMGGRSPSPGCRATCANFRAIW